jgi:hypothetical protein
MFGNRSIVLKHLLSFNTLLSHQKHLLDPRSLLRLVPSFVRMKIFGREDMFMEWINLTIDTIRQLKDEDLRDLRAKAGTELAEANCYEEASLIMDLSYKVTDPFSTYTAGVCLFNIGRKHDSL